MDSKPDWCPLNVWNDTEVYTIEQVGRSAVSFHHMMRCRFARAILAERERCAKVCEDYKYEHAIVGARYAKEIRRGE